MTYVYTWMNTMTKLLLILMMVGLWSGCGKDSPTSQKDLLAGSWGSSEDFIDLGWTYITFSFYRDGTYRRVIFSDPESFTCSGTWSIKNSLQLEVDEKDKTFNRHWLDRTEDLLQWEPRGKIVYDFTVDRETLTTVDESGFRRVYDRQY